MPVDLQWLARQVRDEVDTYAFPPVQPGALGEPLPKEWWERALADMREALVAPFWVTVNDGHVAPGDNPVREVVVVADDGADQFLMAFDPNPEGDYVLLLRGSDRHAVSSIRGDAVGCFLAR